MYEANLELLSQVDAPLADRIRRLEAKAVERCRTRSGDDNLVFKEYKKPSYLHSNYSPVKETQKHLKELELENQKLLYVYGLGLGYSFNALTSWLSEDPERYLVYIEDDLRVIQAFLHSEVAACLLEHPQVMLCSLDQKKDPRLAELLCQDLAYYFVGLPFIITALPFYEREKRDTYLSLQRHLLHSSAYVGFVSKESLDHGAPFFQNFYSNLLHLPDVYGWKSLAGAFKGTPAIICGAGPSLNKNIDLLKTLGNRALILAGGSAIKALSGQGIIPHLGGSVDPNRLQHERMLNHTAYELPTFFKGRVYHGVLHALQGPRIYLSKNNCYPVTDWFEEELGIDEPKTTEGHNVLHLLIDLARRMGCSPIIFVGMDLAFTGLQQYASDVVQDNQMSVETLTKGSHLNDNAFPRKDIYGNTVYTLWKWIAEASYTATYAEKHKETSFINATEGGLGFEGIPNLSLQEVAREHLVCHYDIQGKLHRLLQQGRYSRLTRDAVLDRMLNLYASLHRCVQLCDDLLKALELFETHLKQGQKKAISDSGKRVEDLQQTLSDEVACHYILEPVSHMRSILFERRFDQLGYEDRPLSDLERMLERSEANRKEVESLQDAALVNLRLLRASVTTFGKQGFCVQTFIEGCSQWEREEVVQ